MFNQLVVSGVQGKTHKPWSVVLSALVQSLAMGILILMPLIYTEALPKAVWSMFLVAPVAPPPPTPASPSKPVKAPKVIDIRKMMAPARIPTRVPTIQDSEPVVYENTGPGSIGDSVEYLDRIISATPVGPPPPPKPASPERIRVGGVVEKALLLNEVRPQYPQIAIAARVSGTVVLHAIIAKDGTVRDLQYVSGPPLLIKAAMDAVKEWRYRPMLLNKEPVEVDTTIDVVFNLGG